MAPDPEQGYHAPDPTKPTKIGAAEIRPPSPPLSNRPCHILMSFLKSALTACLLLSLSLFFYSLFSRPIPAPHSWLSSFSVNRTATPTAPSRPISTSRSPTTLSHVVFGLAGSSATWHNRRHYSDLWWSPNSTRGFVFLDRPPPDTLPWPPTSPPYRVSPTQYRAASDRIALIIKEIFQISSMAEPEQKEEEEARWFVMGDDDTVFFKENLVTVLSRYDHREMWYVGGVSESVEQNVMHSYRTAFGGGGFAISRPLACQLAAGMEGCVERYREFYGSDEKVSACVGELGVALTRESGFHQLDIRGDPYGLLAAHPVTPLVSLHHLDYVDPLFPHQTQLHSLSTLHRSYRLDPARTLQQSICYSRKRKLSVSVSWGYTVQLYPSLLPTREIEVPLQTFKTWRSWGDGPFVFTTRPLSPDPCNRPVVFFLDRAEGIGKGSNKTTTSYRRAAAPASEDGKICNKTAYGYAMGVDKITVVASKMDPAEWSTAPRRQCCEVRTGWSLTRSLQIVVRSCGFGETITA